MKGSHSLETHYLDSDWPLDEFVHLRGCNDNWRNLITHFSQTGWFGQWILGAHGCKSPIYRRNGALNYTVKNGHMHVRNSVGSVGLTDGWYSSSEIGGSKAESA